jgi:hypothetical protein
LIQTFKIYGSDIGRGGGERGDRRKKIYVNNSISIF